jgi:hypothetical protein
MIFVQMGLLIFGLVMACAAAGVVLYCFLTEVAEAWDIARNGWARGHHRHHLVAGEHPASETRDAA